jgi:hypothetical protein
MASKCCLTIFGRHRGVTVKGSHSPVLHLDLIPSRGIVLVRVDETRQLQCSPLSQESHRSYTCAYRSASAFASIFPSQLLRFRI